MVDLYLDWDLLSQTHAFFTRTRLTLAAVSNQTLPGLALSSTAGAGTCAQLPSTAQVLWDGNEALLSLLRQDSSATGWGQL